MARIELKELIVNMNPEQQNFFSWFYSVFDSQQIGVNRHIQDITPAYFLNGIGGNFLIYDATKIYISLYFKISRSQILASTTPYINFYNELNILNYTLQKSTVYYNLTTAANGLILLTYKTSLPFYFSRFTYNRYSHIQFNGYIVTLN
jgi:hypothetical protein